MKKVKVWKVGEVWRYRCGEDEDSESSLKEALYQAYYSGMLNNVNLIEVLPIGKKPENNEE